MRNQLLFLFEFLGIWKERNKMMTACLTLNSPAQGGVEWSSSKKLKWLGLVVFSPLLCCIQVNSSPLIFDFEWNPCIHCMHASTRFLDTFETMGEETRPYIIIYFKGECRHFNKLGGVGVYGFFYSTTLVISNNSSNTNYRF
jgi:hypothetical protein